jgi:hypothetical protein
LLAWFWRFEFTPKEKITRQKEETQMKKYLFILVLGFVTNIALADTVTYSHGNVPGTQDGYSEPWSFPMFDPAYGTLNSVQFEMDAWISGTLSVHSLGEGWMTIYLGEYCALWGFSQRLAVGGGYEKYADVTFTVPYNQGGSTYVSYPNFHVSSPPTTIWPSWTLNQFIGTGNVGLSFEAGRPGVSYSADGMFGFGGTDLTAVASGTVTYDYTPIPEPATICLLGLSALGLLRRKK